MTACDPQQQQSSSRVQVKGHSRGRESGAVGRGLPRTREAAAASACPLPEAIAIEKAAARAALSPEAAAVAMLEAAALLSPEAMAWRGREAGRYGNKQASSGQSSGVDGA